VIKKCGGISQKYHSFYRTLRLPKIAEMLPVTSVALPDFSGFFHRMLTVSANFRKLLFVRITDCHGLKDFTDLCFAGQHRALWVFFHHKGKMGF
jgi:hypothetical protein